MSKGTLIALWTLSIFSGLLLTFVTSSLIYMSTLLTKDQRDAFTIDCHTKQGIAIESRDSLNRVPTLYCISNDLVVDDLRLEIIQMRNADDQTSTASQ